MITAPLPPVAGRPWSWVPTLYFSQGLPNVVMTSVAVVLLKTLGVANTDIAFYTSAAYLPWVIKPLWAPWVERAGRKRRWILVWQAVLAGVFAAIAWQLDGAAAVPGVVGLLWLMAFVSATHDIVADGFYLDALPPHRQAAFVGVRSVFFRLAMIAGKGGLVGLAGWLMVRHGATPVAAWKTVFLLLAAWFGGAALLHAWSLPAPTEPPPDDLVAGAGGFARTYGSFAAKPGIGAALFFLLTYRLAEAFALKLVEPFLLDPVAKGGLGLAVEQVGVVYGGVGTAALLAGGLLGGWLISRHGLKRMIWPMLLVMHVPIAAFWLLAVTQPGSLPVITAALAVEQFGYGFGFSAYMVFMMMFAEGEHRTAHYAICTGLMAAGIMLPGLEAGRLQEWLGYEKFFALVCVLTLPSFAAVALLRIDPVFGKK